ncbi:MAG: sigma-70 family RNA polymerase sigma factor [Bacteroidota bacterium]
MSDLLLWQRLKEGHKSALATIYNDHAVALLKYGKKFSRNTQLIEDCIQDLFVELWKNREGLSPTDSIQRYLLVALRRKVIRQLQQFYKRNIDSEPTELNFEAELSIDEAIVQTEMASERVIQLKEAMEKLSKRQKEAVYLKYISGMDYEDISAIMDLNYQSVRNLVSTALKKMKGILIPTLLLIYYLWIEILFF